MGRVTAQELYPLADALYMELAVQHEGNIITGSNDIELKYPEMGDLNIDFHLKIVDSSVSEDGMSICLLLKGVGSFYLMAHHNFEDDLIKMAVLDGVKNEYKNLTKVVVDTLESAVHWIGFPVKRAWSRQSKAKTWARYALNS